MIRLTTLGALDLRDGDGVELRTVLTQPRRFALLAYLAVATPHGFHRRDQVLPLFWPEHDAERARASLNRTLYFLRHELGESVIQSRGDEEIGIDPEALWCDAAAFDAAVLAHRYEETLELYRGDLLPGFFVSQAPGLDDWLAAQRTRLSDSASRAAACLADREETAGRLAAATQWAQRATELAPFQEIPFRRYLSLLDRTGDRAGAVHAYLRFADELARELEVAPAPETRALIEAIRSRTPELNRPDPAGTGEAPRAAAPVAVVRRTRSRWLGAVSAILLATLGLSLLPAETPIIEPQRVDVIPLRNQTGIPALDSMGRHVGDRLTVALKQATPAAQVLLLPGGAGRRPGGTRVSGILDREGPRLIARLWITDVRRNRKAWALTPVALDLARIDQAIEALRTHVVGGVASLANDYHAALLPLAGPPPAFDAYQQFVEAGKQQSQGFLPKALELYRWATASDSTFTWPLIQGALSALTSFQARYEAVDSLLQLLAVRRDRLPALQLHLLDYMLAVRTDDWSASYRALRAAADLAPAQFGYQLAARALELNRPRETAELLQRPALARAYGERAGSVPAYWNLLNFSFHFLSEHRTELEMARRIRQSHLNSASALLQEVRALAALGRVAAVRARLDTLLALPREGWLTPGMSLTLTAKELLAHGFGDAADAVFGRALAWYRERPAAEQASQEWRELVADLLYDAGRWRAADSLYLVLAAEFKTSHNYPDNAWYLGRLGALAARLGDTVQALRLADRLIALDRAQAVPGQESIVARARIAALLGRREEALQLLTDAYSPAGTTELHTDRDFETMAQYPPLREFKRPKG